MLLPGDGRRGYVCIGEIRFAPNQGGGEFLDNQAGGLIMRADSRARPGHLAPLLWSGLHETALSGRGQAAPRDPARLNASWTTADRAKSRMQPVASPTEFRLSALRFELQLDRLGALASLVGLGFERDPHALVQQANARTLDGRDVNEHIVAAIVGRDEAVPLLGIEKLHDASLAHP
jgi:hypothetical protein